MPRQGPQDLRAFSFFLQSPQPMAIVAEQAANAMPKSCGCRLKPARASWPLPEERRFCETGCDSYRLSYVAFNRCDGSGYGAKQACCTCFVGFPAGAADEFWSADATLEWRNRCGCQTVQHPGNLDSRRDACGKRWAHHDRRASGDQI